jgi:hypothetical protein
MSRVVPDFIVGRSALTSARSCAQWRAPQYLSRIFAAHHAPQIVSRRIVPGAEPDRIRAKKISVRKSSRADTSALPLERP